MFAQKLHQLCAPDLHKSLLATWILMQAGNVSLRAIKSLLTSILQQRLLREQGEHTRAVGGLAETLSSLPSLPCNQMPSIHLQNLSLQGNKDKINQVLNAKPLHHCRKTAFIHALLPEQKCSERNHCRTMLVCTEQTPTGFCRSGLVLHSCQHPGCSMLSRYCYKKRKKGIRHCLL